MPATGGLETSVAMKSMLTIWVCAFAFLCTSGCAGSGPPPEGGPWTRGESLPTARSEIDAAVLDGRIYVAGGLTGLATSDVLEVYDSATGKWARRAPLPAAVHHLGVAAAGGRVYVTGGYEGLFFDPDQRAVWAYDPESDVWQQAADMPAPRAAHRLAAIDGKVYVVGGVGPEPTALWAYDPGTDSWDTSREPLPTAREHLAVAVVEGKLYAIGGRWKGRGNLAVLEVYDPATDTWRRLPDMPTPRGGHTAAVLNGRIHVAGGEILGVIGETFAAHEVYDPRIGTWSQAEPLPTARHGLTSATLGARWYVIGGATRAGWRTPFTLTDRVEVYAPGVPQTATGIE